MTDNRWPEENDPKQAVLVGLSFMLGVIVTAVLLVVVTSQCQGRWC